jgi:hypothetical protein
MVLEEAHAFAECARPFLVTVEDDNVNRIGRGELIASAANLALALELYLKALWMLEGRTPPKGPRGHDLAMLYEGLPADLRGELETRFDTINNRTGVRRRAFRVGVIPPEQERPAPSSGSRVNSLPLILERARNDYTTWRYLHEHSRSGELETWDFEYLGLSIARDVLATTADERVRALFGPEVSSSD